MYNLNPRKMSEDQIRKKRRTLEIAILKRKGIHIRARNNMEKAWNKVVMAEENLYKLRRRCEHKFDSKRDSKYMGRGKCEICGHDDY